MDSDPSLLYVGEYAPELDGLTDLELKSMRIGKYFLRNQNVTQKEKYQSRLKKWKKMVKLPEDCDLTTIGQSVIDQNLKDYYLKNPAKFRERVKKGPPSEFRWAAWKTLIGYYEKAGVYENLCCLNSDCEGTIHKDLDRTNPEEPLFDLRQYGKMGQGAMFRILKAYSIYDREVGYLQGLNFIVAFLLSVSGFREKECFWMFIAIIRKLGISGLFEDEFPLLHTFLEEFDTLYNEHLPKLRDHFKSQGVVDHMWVSKWFSTLYLYRIPFAVAVRIWDNIVTKGTVYLFKAGIVILDTLQTELITQEIDEITQTFKDLVDQDEEKTISVSGDKLVLAAKKIKISKHLKSLLAGLQRESNKSFAFETSFDYHTSPTRSPMTNSKNTSSIRDSFNMDLLDEPHVINKVKRSATYQVNIKSHLDRMRNLGGQKPL